MGRDRSSKQPMLSRSPDPSPLEMDSPTIIDQNLLNMVVRAFKGEEREQRRQGYLHPNQRKPAASLSHVSLDLPRALQLPDLRRSAESLPAIGGGGGGRDDAKTSPILGSSKYLRSILRKQREVVN